ncbi:isoprenylcysteine alpha-carbonyl methylesterase ICME-like isoform X2 [Olea europaea var. sylvestris]|uniref:isoprenylcysteine alpha-carbonyl methylesterase ICME-like isoform X2 n=1 Tax=Olea europaea var. sylvestris TaxID=158386 RepID=UPI000C1D08A5|nr:isoprenylcysteine alpha-carbonyl methylesterase ICME-like isoform X2 [Olea europaea var. sylvestris]
MLILCYWFFLNFNLYFFLNVSFIQGRLPLDYTTSCPSSLCHVTHAWLSPKLDLYLPSNEDGLKPVVAFVTGGAWIIGYKAWGSLLGLQLAERDIIVACIDYRNFPQGTISDMVNDVSQGIDYICNNIIEYGGDPNKIYLMGQSAGAHVSSCALVQQAIKESRGDSISWSVSQIKAYFGLSGGYNLPNLVDHFHNRGLYRSIFLSIMEGEKLLEQFSPEVIVQDPSSDKAVSLLPHIVLFHGTTDSSIPSDERFAFLLRMMLISCQLTEHKMPCLVAVNESVVI